MRISFRFLIGLAISTFLCGGVQATPFAYITNGGSGRFGEPGIVSVIDTATNGVVATVQVGLGPFGVAVDPAGKRVYVSNSLSDTISIIDTATNAAVRTIAVGTAPTGVAVTATGERIFVANSGSNNVFVIDTIPGTIVGNVAVGREPGGIAISPSGERAYVANYDSNTISVIDTATFAVVATIAVTSRPLGIAVKPDGTRIYASLRGSNSVAVIDAGTHAVIRTVAVGLSPTGVAVSPAGTRIYVANLDSNSVSVIDTATNSVVTTVGVGAMPAGISVTPSGTRVYVANNDSGNVSVIDTTSNTVIATVAVGEFPVALGQFIGPAVVPPPATSPDLNQHGLTGSWYERATDGQGVEVEVFANPASGAGSTFVSWFTYDTVIGGAERQRWYTAQGPVVTGQPSASLTIYQNTGGNFNAPPITTAQPVGTATLRFDTCTSGQLTYSFTDGTGRSGTIPLTRLTQNVTCSTTTARPTNADFALSGNWYEPATSGQGLTVEVNPNNGAFFAAWYTYAPNGAGGGVAGQRWYTVQSAFAPGMRSIPVTIYETTGGVFDTPTPSGQRTLPVGTGTLDFQTCSAATFSYAFTGGTSSNLSGLINLRRVGPVPPGCTT